MDKDAPITLTYGRDPDQIADLYVPATDGPAPVAVLVHGGFWRERFSRALMDPIARDLQRRGWFAWNVEYRRLGAGGGWPATVEDVEAAVDRLARVDDPRLDLARVVVLGHSAGGQLALLVAARWQTRCSHINVRGVVCLAAVADLEMAARLDLGDGAVPALLGGTPAEIPMAYAVASPRAHLPLRTPHVHVHGYLDQRVPVGMTIEFVAAARAAGDEATAILLEGTDHFALIDLGSLAWREADSALGSLIV